MGAQKRAELSLPESQGLWTRERAFELGLRRGEGALREVRVCEKRDRGPQKAGETTDMWVGPERERAVGGG